MRHRGNARSFIVSVTLLGFMTGKAGGAVESGPSPEQVSTNLATLDQLSEQVTKTIGAAEGPCIPGLRSASVSIPTITTTIAELAKDTFQLKIDGHLAQLEQIQIVLPSVDGSCRERVALAIARLRDQFLPLLKQLRAASPGQWSSPQPGQLLSQLRRQGEEATSELNEILGACAELVPTLRGLPRAIVSNIAALPTVQESLAKLAPLARQAAQVEQTTDDCVKPIRDIAARLKSGVIVSLRQMTTDYQGYPIVKQKLDELETRIQADTFLLALRDLMRSAELRPDRVLANLLQQRRAPETFEDRLGNVRVDIDLGVGIWTVEYDKNLTVGKPADVTFHLAPALPYPRMLGVMLGLMGLRSSAALPLDDPRIKVERLEGQLEQPGAIDQPHEWKYRVESQTSFDKHLLDASLNVLLELKLDATGALGEGLPKLTLPPPIKIINPLEFSSKKEKKETIWTGLFNWLKFAMEFVRLVLDVTAGLGAIAVVVLYWMGYRVNLPPSR